MKKNRILFIDDEPKLLKAFSEYFDGLPFEVFKAINAKSGLELLQAESIDLVIIDNYMPDMSGIDLLKKMRVQGIKTPALIVTGYGSIESSVEAMKSGAVDYLEKPIGRLDLIKVVERHLPMKDPWKDSLNTFLYQNLSDESFGLSDVLQHYGFSKSHACRLFKKHLGESFSNRLRNIRLEKAENLIVQSSLSFSEIAYSCGFRSLSAFSRIFKETHGCSPSQYRKNRHLGENLGLVDKQ